MFRAPGELRGRKVVDAAEAGDEARVARRDAPEGEVRKLEVDLLLGEPLDRLFTYRVRVKA